MLWFRLIGSIRLIDLDWVCLFPYNVICHLCVFECLSYGPTLPLPSYAVGLKGMSWKPMAFYVLHGGLVILGAIATDSPLLSSPQHPMKDWPWLASFLIRIYKSKTFFHSAPFNLLYYDTTLLSVLISYMFKGQYLSDADPALLCRTNLSFPIFHAV